MSEAVVITVYCAQLTSVLQVLIQKADRELSDEAALAMARHEVNRMVAVVRR